jgi:glycosyltransferase involved in cell wall biosynthesis
MHLNILFISSWYPSRRDAMSGLFVRKHAQAVAKLCNVSVLYITFDKNIKNTEIVEEIIDGVREVHIYYPFSKNKIIKQIHYLNAYYKGFKYLKKIKFSPQIIHANILTRTGVIALLYKILHKTPYVITEHWSRYLPENNSFKGTFRKFVTKIVVRNASAVMPVSQTLQKNMLRFRLNNPNYKVVSNVVDDFFFHTNSPHTSSNTTKKRILHISCFNDNIKNISGILRTARKLCDMRQDLQFVFAGSGPDFNKVFQYANYLNFPDNAVIFTGELIPEKIAEQLKQSSISLLFSNFETSSVVVLESLGAGIPVVSTPVGCIPEVVNDKNGIIIDIANEEQLSIAINNILNNYSKYDPEQISKNIFEKCSFTKVSETLYSIYKNALIKP